MIWGIVDRRAAIRKRWIWTLCHRSRVVEVMNREDARAVASVTGMLPRVAQAADWAIEAISSGGRLIYVGAGTSGRLGVLDAVECPPTFGVSPDVVVGLIAGGEDAFVKAVEGAEDDMALCVDDLKEIDLKLETS